MLESELACYLRPFSSADTEYQKHYPYSPPSYTTVLYLFSFCSIEGAHRILVATSEGLLYVGNIDPKEGGECKITKEFG